MNIELSRTLMNRLADAGLPIPLHATYVAIRCPIDGVPRLTVESILTNEEAEGLTRVLQDFDFVERIKEPEEASS